MMTPPDLQTLDARSREIFREIVEAFLETGDPVGSRTLSRRAMLHLSPASIRNTMQDLVSLGLLDAPHAMAGRKPTQLGLRFFVDSLLQVGELADAEKREIDAHMAQAGRNRDEVLAAATELISGVAGGAGLVVTAGREAPIKHMEIMAIGPGQGLMILVFEDGQVENRLIDVPAGLTPSGLIEASNFLNARFKGKSLTEARAAVEEALERDRAALDEAAPIFCKTRRRLPILSASAACSMIWKRARNCCTSWTSPARAIRFAFLLALKTRSFPCRAQA